LRDTWAHFEYDERTVLQQAENNWLTLQDRDVSLRSRATPAG
jgi:hypothetical protein